MSKKGQIKGGQRLFQKVKVTDFGSNENSWSLQSADPLATLEIKRGITLEQNNSKVTHNKKLKKISSISKYQSMNVTKIIPVNKLDKNLKDHAEKQSLNLQQNQDNTVKTNNYTQQTKEHQYFCENSIFQISCSQITKKHNKETYTIKVPNCQGLFSSCAQTNGVFQYKQNNYVLYQMKLTNSKYNIKIQGEKDYVPVKFQHRKQSLIDQKSFKTLMKSQMKIQQTIMSSSYNYNQTTKQISISCIDFNIKRPSLSMFNTLIKNENKQQQQLCIIYEKEQRFIIEINNKRPRKIDNHLIILFVISRIDALKRVCFQQ